MFMVVSRSSFQPTCDLGRIEPPRSFYEELSGRTDATRQLHATAASLRRRGDGVLPAGTTMLCRPRSAHES